MTLIPNTYNGLVSAIKALAEDDSQEFTNYIPTAIFLAEENLLKKVDTEGLTFTASVTATPGDNTLTKPSGHRFNKDMVFQTSAGTFEQPTMVPNDYARDYWPAGKTSTDTYPFGKPKYYANEDQDTWLLAPTPASAYVFTAQYTKQLEHVSAGNQTNYYTDYCPDALFYGTMVGMSEYMKDYSTLGVWQQRYTDAVQTLNNEGRRQRRDDGEPPRNPQGGQNTLTGEN